MHVTYRSYLTAGVAAIGAGAIALTPVQPIPNHLAVTQEKAVSTLAVNLASSIDPITPWVDTFKLAAQNLKTLGDFYKSDPLPMLTTIGANLKTYAESGDLQFIAESIKNNINTFFYAPWWNAPGTPIVNGNYPSNYISGTQTVQKVGVLFNSQSSVYGLAAPLIADQMPKLGPILEFAATTYSGQIAGLISPVLSSIVQLGRSFTAVSQFIKDGDFVGAINELINIPATQTNAYLNGAGALDLTDVIKPILPPAIAPLIQAMGLNLGGLISPPVPFNGTLTNVNKPPTTFTGGTFFDIVSAKAGVGGVGAETTGLPVGWVGSALGLGQFLGKEMLVTPPTSTAAVAPTAAVRAAASAPASAPAVEEVAPAVEEVAPAVAAPVVEAPAAPTVSAPVNQKQNAASDNDNNGGNNRGGHKGARGKHHAD